MSKLVLASGSPRRKELLSFLGYDFSVAVSHIDESVLSDEEPVDYVCRLAKEKCLAVQTQFPNSVILAADTSVVIGKKILGKPKDVQDSVKILKLLSNKTHQVLTGVCVFDPDKVETYVKCVETLIKFRELSEQEILKYAESGEGNDKAGAYGFQNSALAFIENVNGSPSNVIGLPIVEVKLALSQISCLNSR